MGATEPLPLAARVNGSPTGANLAKRYLEEHVAVRLKPTTQERVRIVLRRHILPALCKARLMAVERAQVVEPQYKLCDRPVTANKVVKVLAHMYPPLEDPMRRVPLLARLVPVRLKDRVDDAGDPTITVG